MSTTFPDTPMRRTLCGILPFFALSACQEPETKIVEINSAPVSDAGEAVSQSADSPVILDGGGSFDPDGDPIAYHWSFRETPDDSSLLEAEDAFPGNGTTSATTSFQPDETGTYIVTLLVEDVAGAWSEPSHVVVTITDGQQAVADAGNDVAGTEGETITLDGSGSYDPMGRDLAYQWDFQSVPASSGLITLEGEDTVNPTFVADAGGVYIVSLVVDNGVAESAPDTLVARIASADPLAPVALAGDDIEAEDCLDTELDGSGSYDANGDTLSYQWSLQAKPEDSDATNDNFEDRTAANTSFFPDAAGSYILQLAVFDGSEWSAPDLVNLTVTERADNTTPVVDAGNPKNSDGGEAECTEDGYTYDCESCDDMTLELGDDASVNDADGDPLTYQWTVVSGDAEIEDPYSLVTTVSLMDVEATEPGSCEDNEYEFELTVTDCTGESQTDSVVYIVSCCGVEASR